MNIQMWQHLMHLWRTKAIYFGFNKFKILDGIKIESREHFCAMIFYNFSALAQQKNVDISLY